MNIQNRSNNESIITILVSEDVLKKDWDNELDERWDNLDNEKINEYIK